MKKKIEEWLFNFYMANNNYNKKGSLSFVKNYLDDKIAYNYIKKIYKNNILKKEFEENSIKSFNLQNNIKKENDKKINNNKSTYCCKNIYHGNKKKCDIIIGITASNELVLNTVPYMRWSYGMVFLKDSGIEVDRRNHPQLADLSIGVQAGTPPTFVLQRYNLMGKVRPYQLTFDPRKAVIGESMVEDLIDGLVDIVFMSGPIAVYYLEKKGYDSSKYTFIPLETTDQGWGRMDYYTTMGVRDGETDWKKKLNKFIKTNQKEIDAILAKHNIPILELKPGKRKKGDSTTDALIKGRAPVK